MLPPRSTGSAPCARTAAMSELVVVLPLVPVTPMVTAGTQPQEQVHLADHRHPALGLERRERGAQPGLGRREAAADRGRGGHQRLSVEDRGRVDVRPELEHRPGDRRAPRWHPRAQPLVGRRTPSRGRRGRRGSGQARCRCGRAPGRRPGGRRTSRRSGRPGRMGSDTAITRPIRRSRPGPERVRSQGPSERVSSERPSGAQVERHPDERRQRAHDPEAQRDLLSPASPAARSGDGAAPSGTGGVPFHLNHRIWAMSWAVSSTNTKPMTGSSMTWPVMSATTASVAPSDRAPESPMNTSAGWTLNHRKPRIAPMMSAHRMARLGWGRMLSAAMAMKPTNANTSRPPDRPSRPSVMFTALLVATMANAPNRMYSQRVDAARDPRTAPRWP